jgi:Flp pilus assembly protein CpaB
MRVRILLVVIVVIAIAAVAVLVLTSQQNDETPVTTEVAAVATVGVRPTSTPIPPPVIPIRHVVITIQQVARGAKIPAGAVALRPWPADAILEGVGFILGDPDDEDASWRADVVGKRARTDIERGQPILNSMLTEDLFDLDDLADVGSDVAAVIPPGMVAVSVPMDRFTSVAYAIQPGDRVNIIVSLLFTELDREFQSAMPNSVAFISPSVTANESSTTMSLAVGAAIEGRFATQRVPIPMFDFITRTSSSTPTEWPIIEIPSEQPRPRLLVQQTVQDALIIRVGDFPPDGRIFDIPTAQPIVAAAPVEEPAVDDETGGEIVPAASPAIARPDIVTLAVYPQEALVLVWYLEAKIPITFALRSAASTTQPLTDPVTLQYIMDKYNINGIPAKQPYAIEPPIRTIRAMYDNLQTTSLEQSAPPAAAPAEAPAEGQ